MFLVFIQLLLLFQFFSGLTFAFWLGQESDSESDLDDGLGTDLDRDADIQLRFARLEHLLERRPILVQYHTIVPFGTGFHM